MRSKRLLSACSHNADDPCEASQLRFPQVGAPLGATERENWDAIKPLCISNLQLKKWLDRFWHFPPGSSRTFASPAAKGEPKPPDITEVAWKRINVRDVPDANWENQKSARMKCNLILGNVEIISAEG